MRCDETSHRAPLRVTVGFFAVGDGGRMGRRARRAGSGGAAVRKIAGARDRVRWFYAWYVGQLNANRNPLENRAKMAEFTSKRLHKWLQSADYQDYGADYLIQAQDFDADWTRATVRAVTVSGDKARVAATLGTPKRSGSNGEWKLNLQMTRENGVWKIDKVDAPGLN